MSDAAVHMSLTGEEILKVHLNGKWHMKTDVPSTKAMTEQLDRHPSVKRIVFDATELGSWDSSLLIFYFEISKWSLKKKIAVEKDGLPAEVRQLIEI